MRLGLSSEPGWKVYVVFQLFEVAVQDNAQENPDVDHVLTIIAGQLFSENM